MEKIYGPTRPVFGITEPASVSPFTHIMLKPVTKTGSCVNEHAEPERAVQKNVKELSELLDSTN
jgi:hypothetical protein